MRYTYGRQGLKRKRHGTKSHASSGTPKSGGVITTSRGNGDQMVLWWTSYVSNADRVRLELEERIETLEHAQQTLKVSVESSKKDAAQQVQQAQAQREAAERRCEELQSQLSVALAAANMASPSDRPPQSSSDSGKRAKASNSLVLAEKDQMIERLTNELHAEAKAHAGLLIIYAFE